MNRKIVKTLVDELSKHSRIIAPDRELFFNILISTDVPKSSRFYESLPEKQQLGEESGRYHYLSLRRVIRNENARDYQLSQWKKTYELFASALGVYSSDSLSRNLRTDDNLMEMMAQCKEPFSLLGKFQTYDFSNRDNKLFIVTKPILIIPNTKNVRSIQDWEDKNTIYEKEIRLMGLFPIQKRIEQQEYISY